MVKESWTLLCSEKLEELLQSRYVVQQLATRLSVCGAVAETPVEPQSDPRGYIISAYFSLIFDFVISPG